MKVFVVFLGLFLVNLSFMAYHSDVEQFERLQVFLKALAEDCAAGAALYYDEEAYAQGRFEVDQRAGERYVSWQVAEAEQKLSGRFAGQLNSRTTFYDTAVEVDITYTGADLFRLPFLSRDTVIRGARYQWEH